MASSSISNSPIPKLEECNSVVYTLYDHDEPMVVICFFHDMYWGKEEQPHIQSWMARSEPPVCWPQKWLPKVYPKSRILSVLYDSSVLKRYTAGYLDLYILGENLCQDILPKCAPNCPIFLVGHGAGGLVIKSLILAIRDEGFNEKKKHPIMPKAVTEMSFLSNVRGIMYYSTPHHGSRLANCAKYLPACLLGPLLDPLEVLSIQACRLNYTFAKWRRDTDCRTACICAALPTRVAFCWFTQIVKEASARSDVDAFYTIQSDHFNACKPKDENDSGFQMLVNLIAHGMMASSSVEDMPTISSEPAASIEDQAKTECKKLVAEILDRRNLRGGVLWLEREKAKKICQFKEVWDSLSTGLQNAGFQLYPGDDTKCVWRQVCA